MKMGDYRGVNEWDGEVDIIDEMNESQQFGCFDIMSIST